VSWLEDLRLLEDMLQRCFIIPKDDHKQLVEKQKRISCGMRIEQVATFSMGTHPALTVSPLSYQLTEAACQTLAKLC